MTSKLRTRSRAPHWWAACLLAAVACLPIPQDHSDLLAADLARFPDPPGAWPNEPVEFRALGDQPFDAFSSRGWDLIWNDSGWTRLARDPSAPFSPPGVAEINYPVGFPGGIAPGTEYLDVPRIRQVYVGLWLKVSDPWQGHSRNVNKIQFLFFRDGGDMPMVMYGQPGGPYELRVIPQFPLFPSSWLTPNASRAPFTLGSWHRIEWLIAEGAAGEPNGICRWWVDGQLVGDYADVVFSGSPLATYKLSPTWGGMGEVKRENDWYQVDHVHISGR